MPNSTAICRTAPIVAAVLVAFAGCNLKSGGPSGGPSVPPGQMKLARQVSLAPVTQQQITYSVETVGTLEPDRHTSIAAGVAGVVDEVLFREGDVVEPGGAVLVRIDQRKFAASAALAKANEERASARLALAQDLVDRAGQLRDKHAISAEETKQRTQDLEMAKAEIAGSKAERQMAEINLAKSRVRPPYAGQINDRFVAVGDYVKEETVIATIADLSVLRLTTFVPELAATRVHVGDTLEFTLESLPQKKYQARIMFVSTVADPQTHMFSCKAEVPDPDAEMKPGMFARVQIPIERHADSFIVPEESVRGGEQGFLVYMPKQETDKDGKPQWVAQARRIQVGLRQPGYVEVLAGLAAGDRVVTRGADTLDEGTPIDIHSDKAEQGRVDSEKVDSEKAQPASEVAAEAGKKPQT